ncbi:glutamine synthetase (plasmid) [Deinococcus aetherius]|uniref:Glutamine synthetase n=1 Tax=Deinococcus aetherius TaxID=200252 RepID=A0ABM8AJR7_9DEIO|nr:glutamine synthetase family protein [Deinococcus aetherius]BDP44065.1 glutamine synthetase [Deinococcus aetherius]
MRDLDWPDLAPGGVQWVRVHWCDNANVIRAKAAHVGLMDPDAGLPGGIGLAAAQMALPVMFDALAPGSGLSPVGEVRLVPDGTTLRTTALLPGHALVLGDLRGEDGRAWEHCPRDFLRGQLGRLEAYGLTLTAAFENEFFLLRRDPEGRLVPADRTVYAQTGAFNAHLPFLHDLTAALTELGLTPEHLYPESAPGQIELTVRYRVGVDAADGQILFREAARAAAHRHGLVACFLAKVTEGAAGSGCHINLGLRDAEGGDALGDPDDPDGLSPEGRAFLAGVLVHLPALTAVTVPLPGGYRRLKPHFWAGAYCAWGVGNREAALRVTRQGGQVTRFEVKAADGTANPYLALGAVVAAGLDGLERGLSLPPEATVDPALLSEAERAAARMFPLPASLSESLDALEADGAVRAAFGEARLRAYVAVKRLEHEALSPLSPGEELELLAERY